MHYANISAKTFIGKPWKTALEKLEQLLKLKLPEKLKLIEMLLLRNKIIHEGFKADVSHDDVFDYFDSVSDTLDIISTKLTY